MHLKNVRRDFSFVPPSSNFSPSLTSSRFCSDGTVYDRAAHMWSDINVGFYGTSIVGIAFAPTDGQSIGFRIKASSVAPLPFYVCELTSTGVAVNWSNARMVHFGDHVDDLFVLSSDNPVGFGFMYSGTQQVTQTVHGFRMDSRAPAFHISEV